MNYDKMSDVRLSAEISEILFSDELAGEVFTVKDSGSELAFFRDGGGNCTPSLICSFDINSWSDMGPLIAEHGITILFDGDSVEVSFEFDGVESIHGTDEELSHHISGNKEDVLRVAAICYLKLMKLTNEGKLT